LALGGQDMAPATGISADAADVKKNHFWAAAAASSV